jgi:stress response protein YsnF
MERKQRSDRFTEIEDLYADYEVYDRKGEKIGKVDDLFVDESDRPEYIGVKMGLLPKKPALIGSRSTLIPMEVVRVDEGHKRIEVSAEKNHVKEAPAFDDDWEITPSFEESVRHHYGLEPSKGAARGAYSAYYEDEGEEYQRVEKEPIDAERRDVEHSPEQVGTREAENELRVQRTEEELGAGTREREPTGGVRIRKRVRTDRERVSDPRRREEVDVEDHT